MKKITIDEIAKQAYLKNCELLALQPLEWEEISEKSKSKEEKLVSHILSIFANSIYEIEEEKTINLLLTPKQYKNMLDVLSKYIPNFHRESKTNELNYLIWKALRDMDDRRQEAAAELHRFQGDVGNYLRAIALVAASIGDAQTHKEKNARIRGLVAQIESAIKAVNSGYEYLIDNNWTDRPDLFRSDYPVRQYLERANELQRKVKYLEGKLKDNDIDYESTFCPENF